MKIVTVARKPLPDAGVARNCLEHQTGALNINACRVAYRSEEDKTLSVGHGAFEREAGVGSEFPHHKENWGAWTVNHQGRWPANLILQHTSGCKIAGTRRVKTGVAVRERGGGKTIFSETKKPALPNMSYADEDGTEEVAHWECEPGCPAAELDRQGGDASRFFLQVSTR